MTPQEQINEEMFEASREEIQRNFDRVCSAALNNPHGLELIKLLSQKFLAQAVADPKLNVNHAYFREGQNDLVRLLRTAIKRHANS